MFGEKRSDHDGWGTKHANVRWTTSTIKRNGAHASRCRWHVVAARFPSNVAKWSGDSLNEIVRARDKGVLGVIAVAALGEVN